MISLSDPDYHVKKLLDKQAPTPWEIGLIKLWTGPRKAAVDRGIRRHGEDTDSRHRDLGLLEDKPTPMVHVDELRGLSVEAKVLLLNGRGFSYREAAKVLGINRGVVHRVLARHKLTRGTRGH